ncbi:hypothetical protein ACFU9X_38920 [Streptomyces atratus]|uniref:hypothetical protein n=1 Tax=Streptomyces atratus TaxID=1893 RepID=UPI0036BEDCF1
MLQATNWWLMTVHVPAAATTPCACSSGTSTRITQAPTSPSSARSGVAGALRLLTAVVDDWGGEWGVCRVLAPHRGHKSCVVMSR